MGRTHRAVINHFIAKGCLICPCELCVCSVCGNICSSDRNKVSSTCSHKSLTMLRDPDLPSSCYKFYEAYNDTIFVPHTLTHTHTHLFPFPLRQLCQPVTSTCVGHKTEKGQLIASLSWLAGSHLSHINTGHTLTQVFTYPPHMSQSALAQDTTLLSYGIVNETIKIPQVALVFTLLEGYLLRKSCWT